MFDPYEEIYTYPFRVTDLKQWAYCHRLLYFLVCLPDIRPRTYLMEAGKEAGEEEVGRIMRRSLQIFGAVQGRREFNVRVRSAQWNMRGVVDMVIWVDEPAPGEVIPVDFKLSQRSGEHVKLQLMAYGLLLEEMSGKTTSRGYLYEIPLRRVVEVPFTPSLRRSVREALEDMKAMLEKEQMPQPTTRRTRCVGCEFRRFCNDVF